MSADDSSNATDIDAKLGSDSNLNSGGDDAADNDSSKALTIPAPAVCLVRFAGDAAGGAVMGSIFGYGDVLLYSSCLVWLVLSAVALLSELRFYSLLRLFYSKHGSCRSIVSLVVVEECVNVIRLAA